MMMIAPYSLARQKKVAQGEEKEEAGDRIKGGQTRTPTPRGCFHMSNVYLGQGCRMQGTGENMDGGVGFHYTGRAEGARN